MRSNVRRPVGLRCAILPVVAGVALSMGCLLLSKGASAQTVKLTYLANAVDNNGTEGIVTKQVPVISGVANISINTDYIDDISVENGSAFIVEPTVDPKVTLQETLYNFSGKPFYDLTYTLPDGLYFKSSDLSSGGFFSNTFSSVALSDQFTFTDPTNANNPDNGLTVFRTVTFSPTTSQVPLNNGQSGNFIMTFYTPAATSPATSYTLATIPLTTPEPGSMPLFATACLPLLGCLIVRARKRNEA